MNDSLYGQTEDEGEGQLVHKPGDRWTNQTNNSKADPTLHEEKGGPLPGASRT